MFCGSFRKSEGESSSACVPQIQVLHPSGHQLKFRSNFSAPEHNNSHCWPVSQRKTGSVGGLSVFRLTVFVLAVRRVCTPENEWTYSDGVFIINKNSIPAFQRSNACP